MMNLKMHGVKVLGLFCVAALSAMALSAAGAQASEWKIGGKTLVELGIKEESFAGKLAPGTTALFLWNHFNVNYKCTGVEVLSGKIKQLGSLTLSLRYSGCKVFADEPGEPELKSCGVKSSGAVAGEIQTASLSGEIFSGVYLLIKPTGGVFDTLEFTGASCAFKGTYSIGGTYVAELGNEEKELLLRSIKIFPGDGIKFGEYTASLQGALLLELNGAKKGSAWTGRVAGSGGKGEWKVGGKTFKELAIIEETAGGSTEVGTNPSLLVKTLNVQIKCSFIGLGGTVIQTGTIEGFLHYSECKLFADEAKEPELSACGVQTTGAGGEEIESIQFVGEVFLSGEATYVLVAPLSGTTFSTVELTGASCAPQGVYPVTKTVVIELGSEAKALLLKPVKEFAGDVLRFGENKAFLQGSALVGLGGAKAEAAWTGF